MKAKDIDKKHLFIGGGLILLVLVLFFKNKLMRNNTEQKKIDVKVKIEDENGNVSTYDPNDLLERLNKGLTTRYYFDFSERCEPIKELYNLDSVRFMATIRAYKTKYNESIETHMKACYVDCNTGEDVAVIGSGKNYFELIYQRIDALKDIIK